MPSSESSPTELKTEDASRATGDVEPSFGWNAYAEVINGRLAMLAVLGVLMLEWLTNQDVFTWLGLR